MSQQQIVIYGSGNVLLNNTSTVVSADNATSSVIGDGDTIVVVEALTSTTNQYAIVGVISRLNQLTPIPVPSITLSPNFILSTSSV